MYNEVARLRSLDEISAEFNDLKIRLRFPEGPLMLRPEPSIQVTNPTVIVRAADNAETAEMVTRRWSWPGSNGKPLFHFHSEGRTFGTTRGGAGSDATGCGA